MLLGTYTKWILEADGGTERDKLRAAFAGPDISPLFPQSPEAQNKSARKPLISNGLPADGIGRREWTRTIDPHHVKVVL